MTSLDVSGLRRCPIFDILVTFSIPADCQVGDACDLCVLTQQFLQGVSGLNEKERSQVLGLIQSRLALKPQSSL